jgi:hypothetical protein
MERELNFSPHAMDRIRERLQLSLDEIAELVREDAYAHVARIADSKKGVDATYLLLWDYKASKPALMVTEERRDGLLVVVTAYMPGFLQRPRPGVVVWPAFIQLAYNRAHDFMLLKGRYWPRPMQLYAVVSSEDQKDRKIFLGQVRVDEYHVRYKRSLRTYLRHILETDRHGRVDQMCVPKGCKLQVVLYHYPAPSSPAVFDHMKTVEATACPLAR